MKRYPSYCPANHSPPYPVCIRPEACEVCQAKHVDEATK
jgi:hypothetical protein